MRRGVVGLDRFVALVVGLAVIAVGAALAWWWAVDQGWTGVGRDLVPQELSASGLERVSDQGWWPWALGIGGALLVLLGLRWALAHVPRRGVGDLDLPGSSPAGRIAVDADAVAAGAADAFEQTPGVRSCRGRVRRQRGRLVVQVSATLEQRADLSVVADGADRVAAEVATVLGRSDVRSGFQLDVAGRSRTVRAVD